MLEVTVYSGLQLDEDSDVFEVDYVSLVSDETYGPPALIAPPRDGNARANVGQRVLYLNTRFVPMFEIVRRAD